MDSHKQAVGIHDSAAPMLMDITFPFGVGAIVCLTVIDKSICYYIGVLGGKLCAFCL